MVPAGMIPPQEKQVLQELTGKLGYLPVDEEWGTAAVPADLRVADGQAQADGSGSAELPESAVVGDRLRAGLSPDHSAFTRRRASRWRVDLPAHRTG